MSLTFFYSVELKENFRFRFLAKTSKNFLERSQMLNFFLNFLQKRQNLSAACEKGTIFEQIFWLILPPKFFAKHLFSQNSFFPRQFSVPEKCVRQEQKSPRQLKHFRNFVFSRKCKQ
jgi:hypothetical protein